MNYGKTNKEIFNALPEEPRKVAKTCYDCLQHIGEECGIDYHEIYYDSEICDSFEE